MLKRFALIPVTFLLFSFLSAKDFWVERPFTQWSQKEAIRMLTKSPWSSTQTVRFRTSSFRTGPSPTESQAECNDCTEDPAIANLANPQLLGRSSTDNVQQRKYFVRFRTATPVRMALARIAMLMGNSSEEKAQEYVESSEFPGQIVVVVEPANAGNSPELDLANLGYLKENTYLLLKTSKTRIPLRQYVSPSQFGGTRAFFIFPREEEGKELVPVGEKEIRFVCRLGPETKIERKFKLGEMLFRGVLDL